MRASSICSTICSRCECQAILSATLDEHRQVVESSAERTVRERAPAHTIGADSEHFDVAWQCPFCGRNTLRSFHAGAAPPALADARGARARS